jgi:hypothetical protein
MTLAPNVMRIPTFLLIQHGTVRRTDSLPKELYVPGLKEWQGFQIAVGYTEGGKRHVAGVIADIKPLWGAGKWDVTFSTGQCVHIAAHDSVVHYVLYNVGRLLSDGRLYDSHNLPAPLTIKPVYIGSSGCPTDAASCHA